MDFDVAVIGGGIAGASVAAHLVPTASVVVIERESQPGYHATGRSAALFSEIYGNAAVRALSRASRAFLQSPPADFAGAPILGPRGALHIGGRDDVNLLDLAFETGHRLVPSVARITAAQVLDKVPAMRPEAVAGGGVFEPDARDIDTNGLLQGFLRRVRNGGGKILLDAPVAGLERDGNGWRILAGGQEIRAGVVVDAAGAWGDSIAALAGAGPVGLAPKRRTAFLIAPPNGMETRDWPLTIGAREDLYFKPDAGKLLVSPADETPSEPVDAQPDELDIAIAADRLAERTTIEVRRIEHKWAGLRTFAPDKTPVVGFDPAVAGFFWLVGQGGYGFQTAPAMARLAAALVSGKGIPAEIQDQGITTDQLSPARFATRRMRAARPN
ncbi:NAD(P)/FAD-dependent oxidoreductase [Dongia sedimenti]|uniref:FAD-dependent oxidoreductase n=1 Tax=Dongia sedimenti TaxID=3064282 RepID=A0ABU0YT79_9PROT|nr:FAD-dependent oxidoreductase [Rhodospirillaceae bacterium R-7]